MRLYVIYTLFFLLFSYICSLIHSFCKYLLCVKHCLKCKGSSSEQNREEYLSYEVSFPTLSPFTPASLLFWYIPSTVPSLGLCVCHCLFENVLLNIHVACFLIHLGFYVQILPPWSISWHSIESGRYCHTIVTSPCYLIITVWQTRHLIACLLIIWLFPLDWNIYEARAYQGDLVL